MVTVQQIEEVYGHAQEALRLLKAIYAAKRPAPADVKALEKAVEAGRTAIKGEPRQEVLRKICKRLLGNNEVAICGCEPATCANGTVFNLGELVFEAVRDKAQLPGTWREIRAFVCRVSNEHDAAVDLLNGVVAPTPEVKWSKPDGPSQWGRVFGFSADTFIRRCEAGQIRHKKFNSKSYAVNLDDIPVLPKPKANGQK